MKESYYLGIFGGQGPNPSAAILLNGKIVAFAEEERFNRIKMSPSSLPFNAIDYCMKTAAVTFEELGDIGFGWDCERYVRDLPNFFENQDKLYPVEDNSYNKLHEARLMSGFNPMRIRTELKVGLAKRGYAFNPEKLKFLPHHLCHVASTFYASSFNEAVVLTIDGSGEEFATIVWHVKNGEYEKLKTFMLPHTIGGVYATVTEYLGFKPDEEEGKVMGLAPYGEYSEELQRKFDELIPYDQKTGDYTVNPYMRFLGKRSFGQKFTDKFVEIFGPAKLRDEPINKHHKDIAFNLQWRVEKIACLLIANAIEQTGCSNVCIAGGVGMNCKMNGEVGKLPEVKALFVQPASADNGTALGAAYLVAKESGVNSFAIMKHAYWGPEFNDDEVERAIQEAKLSFRISSNMEKEVAEMLAHGKIIGWVQGRMEVGARALGGRSILASPVYPDMRDKLNKEVKHRESWRPFCPSLPIDSYRKYFGDALISDFMIMAYPMKEEFHEILPSAVHVDGTVRPQAVVEKTNPKFHQLLKEFGEITGHPVLINTSFNIQGEPIVLSPQNALRCFGGTGIDVLVMNNYIVEK